MSNSYKNNITLINHSFYLAVGFLVVSLILLPAPTFAADWGRNIANKINDIYTQLQPIVLSLATLGIAFGAIQWATSGGNVDKKAMGKKILFGAAVSIALYVSAPAFTSWAVENLKIEF